MGELTGPFEFSGRLGNVVAYRLGDKIVVRTIGSTKATQQHPHTQQAQSSFGDLSTQNKFFRDVLAPFLRELHRKQLDNDVMSLLSAIRNLDPRPEAERSLSGGLETVNGAELFNGFEFNTTPALVRYLLQASVVTEGVALLLQDFIPLACLRSPQAATHAVLSSCAVRLDFKNLTGAISVSPAVVVCTTDKAVQRIELIPEALPAGEGIYLLLLKIVFFERLNGVDYPLSGAQNGCMVVKALKQPSTSLPSLRG